MRDFHNLKVWHKARELVLAIYRASASFPQSEIYGLTSQLRRASISIVSNIAEGCGRTIVAEFARFLEIAMGSASEVQCQLILAHDIGFLGDREFELLENDAIEIKRMLTTLTKKLKAGC